MFKTILFSMIGHVLIFVFILLIGFFQPRSEVLKRTRVTRVKFYEKPKPKKPKPVRTPKVRKPDPTPRPTPRKTTKPTPRKTPRKTKKKTVEKKKPKKTVKKPEKTPIPARTPWPPIPPEVKRRHETNPTPAPPPPSSEPLNITHKDLPDYYLMTAKLRIEENFRLKRSDRYDGIYCRVEFKVNREGKIYDTKVVGSTGNSSLDRIALEALERTGRLAPLPDSVRENHLVITASFKYFPG